MTEGRRFGRGIHAPLNLKAGCIKRTRSTQEALMSLLISCNVKEVWRSLRGWYHKTWHKVPKPCYTSLEKQTLEQEQLYDRVPPPGDPILSRIEQPHMNDNCPSDHEGATGGQEGRQRADGWRLPDED